MTALAALGVAWVVCWGFGMLARRVKQPAVLGELIGGVLLGSSVSGILDPSNALVAAVSAVGVVTLLFTIGLETDVRSLLRVGSAAATVAVVGVLLPSIAGYLAATSLGLGTYAAIVCGTALCATSVGITARVLKDIGRLESPEGKVILGAAVIDDIIGLLILAIVASLVSAGGTISLGSFAIVGAFGAGLLLHKSKYRETFEVPAKWMGKVVVPLFFASVGAAVDLTALSDKQSLTLGVTLIACGIVGKLLAGLGALELRADKLLIGIGMVPRGEVGLIFAQTGLTAGAVTSGQYGALMLMVLVTTFVTPPALAWRARQLAKTT